MNKHWRKSLRKINQLPNLSLVGVYEPNVQLLNLGSSLQNVKTMLVTKSQVQGDEWNDVQFPPAMKKIKFQLTSDYQSQEPGNQLFKALANTNVQSIEFSHQPITGCDWKEFHNHPLKHVIIIGTVSDHQLQVLKQLDLETLEVNQVKYLPAK